MFDGFNGFLIASLSVITSLSVARIFVTETHLSPIKGRSESIDGLRGFLALMVFLHHSSFWWQYIHTGVWSDPDSLFYTNIGKIAVIFFFMITGFLFFGKLISNKSVNWEDLFWSRIMRLTPMYLVSLSLLFIIVFYVSDWKINTGIANLIISMARWVPFSFLGMPDVNGLHKTSLIMAGVPWSLVYEWFFYLSLPFMAFIMRRDKFNTYTILSIVSVFAFIFYPSLKIHILSFVFGYLAAKINHKLPNSLPFNKILSSLFVIVILCVTCFLIPNPYNPITISLCGIAFILISNGCDIFGVLKIKTCQVFGEATYSMYLLHGIILFITFKIILPVSYVNQINSLVFSAIIIILSGFITLISLLCFRYIETPCSKFKKFNVLTYTRRKLQ
ncbi:TPA: acyltransferase [Escherichia coli]|nr:acyltransferase [Escherichia coli]